MDQITIVVDVKTAAAILGAIRCRQRAAGEGSELFAICKSVGDVLDQEITLAQLTHTPDGL